jgi:hypothetical protein
MMLDTHFCIEITSVTRGIIPTQHPITPTFDLNFHFNTENVFQLEPSFFLPWLDSLREPRHPRCAGVESTLSDTYT